MPIDVNLYDIAYRGVHDILEGRAWREFRAGNEKYSEEWQDHAETGLITRPSLGPKEVILVNGANSKVLIEGTVSQDAIIICSGAGTEIEIYGMVQRGAMVICRGVNATILVYAAIGEKTTVKAVGDGARVISAHDEDVLDIRTAAR